MNALPGQARALGAGAGVERGARRPAGRPATQCQKPLGVGASGSKQVTV